jgi:hypothetical protein
MSDLVQPDTFHLFALLPKELRLQIWNYALKARVIPLHRTSDPFKGRGVYFHMRISTVGFMALTTNHPSLDILRHVCPEAQLVCRRRFVDFDVWDLRKNCLGTLYDPARDVVYFSHSIDAGTLEEFAAQHPLQASRCRFLALPGIISSVRASRREILATLHTFENLVEVIIIVGSAGVDGDGVSWLGGTEMKGRWELPRSAEETLEQLKNDMWPDWKIPIVTVVRSQEDILSNERMAIWI